MMNANSGFQPLTHDNRMPRILVVDDEIGPRESLRLILSPACEVLVAKDGEEALAQFDEHNPDMVISDIRMPRLNGIDLMKRIKERSPDTPFVLLTGFGTLRSAQEAVRADAFDYISKPYNVEQIRQVVSNVFDQAGRKSDMASTLSRLEQTNRQLEERVLELYEKAVAAKLSLDMAHDLNGPFQVIQGYVELLEEALGERLGGLEEEEREMLDVIRREAGRCIQLSRKLLDFASPDHADFTEEDLNSLVDDVLFVFRTHFSASRVAVIRDLSRTPVMVPCEAAAVRRLFYNLAMNAVQALGDYDGPRELSVTTRIQADNAVVVIADTGPGMPEAVRQRAFERFFTTKSPGQGPGLGLAICREVVAAHAGTIELESAPDRGTRFRITLPLSRAPR
jgi:signal transduction histidine kinase